MRARVERCPWSKPFLGLLGDAPMTSNQLMVKAFGAVLFVLLVGCGGAYSSNPSVNRYKTIVDETCACQTKACVDELRKKRDQLVEDMNAGKTPQMTGADTNKTAPLHKRLRECSSYTRFSK